MRARLLILSLVLLTPSVQAEELVTLSTRPGVEQKFLLIKNPNAAVSVILFAGGQGRIKLSGDGDSVTVGSGNNFLVRSRQLFADQNLNVAVIDAPSDRQNRDGMLNGFRTSAEHVTDIDAVIAELRKRFNLPVWLVGTSRGTESAAHIAIHSGQKPAGLVLTSSMSVETSKGTAVTEMPLARIKVPTLLVAHKQDECKVTPPEGAEEIKAGLKKVPRVEVAYFEGGRSQGNPCKAKAHHGFLGIEESVVKRIADFIKANK